jgi:hypothetical protein
MVGDGDRINGSSMFLNENQIVCRQRDGMYIDIMETHISFTEPRRLKHTKQQSTS